MVQNINGIPNQFIITQDNGDVVFQSYERIIVKKSKGKIYLDKKYWDYSKTTGKYRNIFLGESKPDTECRIALGTYILTNLN